MSSSAQRPAVDISTEPDATWLEAQTASMLPKRKLALAEKTTVRAVKAPPLPTGPVTADALGKTSLRFTASVPDLAYTDAAGSPPAIVRGLSIEASASPGKPPEAKVAAKIEGTPPGDLSASVRALDPLTMLAEEKGLERFHIAADVGAKSLPTGLVDALAAQGGLLVDVLGPRFDLMVKSDSIRQTDGTFVATLESENASVRCDHGSMRTSPPPREGEGKNSAEAPALALFSRRSSNLVPARRERGEGEAEGSGDRRGGISFPLDADLRARRDRALNLGGDRTRCALSDVSGRLRGGEHEHPEIACRSEGVGHDGAAADRRKTYRRGDVGLWTSRSDQTSASALRARSGVSRKLAASAASSTKNTPVPITGGTWKTRSVGRVPEEGRRGRSRSRAEPSKGCSRK
jgi:hypothetical protein